MISTKKWVAAGSTATLLAGGLFLGAPTASAAPGDAACLQASTQFEAALGRVGVDATFVNDLELATAAVVEAEEQFVLVSEAAAATEAAVAADAQIVKAEEALDSAETATGVAVTALDAAKAASTAEDPKTDPLIIKAQQALLDAQDAEEKAGEALNAAVNAYGAVMDTDEVRIALQALDDAAIKAGDLVDRLSGNEALADELLTLFEAFLVACDASTIGAGPAPVEPAPVAPAPVVPTAPVAPVAAPVTPVVVAPVAPVAPVGAPTGTNKGLNVQTAVVTEDNSAAVTLIAALLAIGVAVPAVTAARMRRLERAQR